MKIIAIVIGVGFVITSCHLIKPKVELMPPADAQVDLPIESDPIINPSDTLKVSENAKNIKKIDYHLTPLSELIDTAKKDDKLVILFFSAEWCKPCKVYKNITFEEPETKKYLIDNYLIKYLDVETDFDGIEFNAKYNIKNLPTLVFLNHKGAEIKRIVGHLSGYTFLRNITEIKEGNLH